MGLNQGYLRLVNGHTKTLNASEKSRGWVFITKDKKGLKLLQPRVNVKYQGELTSFPVDNSGRILTGKAYVSKLPSTFTVCLADGVLEITK